MKKKSIIIVFILLGFGLAKESWQKNIKTELYQEKLLAKPLSFSTREKIGQTASAITLGGLRTVIATFLNLRAYTYFENQDWANLEDTYHSIVTLQPQNEYYWDNGAWNLAYNAAAAAEKNETLPPLRAKALHKVYVDKGKAFLEKGLENIPDSSRLWNQLGTYYSNPRKYPDFQKAADAFKKASDLNPNNEIIRRAYLYSLARVPSEEKKALALIRQQYRYELTTRTYRVTPTLACLLFALESRQPDALPTMTLIETIFPNKKTAYDQLKLYFQNKKETMPMDGVEHALKLLETNL